MELPFRIYDIEKTRQKAHHHHYISFASNTSQLEAEGNHVWNVWTHYVTISHAVMSQFVIFVPLSAPLCNFFAPFCDCDS